MQKLSSYSNFSQEIDKQCNRFHLRNNLKEKKAREKRAETFPEPRKPVMTVVGTRLSKLSAAESRLLVGSEAKPLEFPERGFEKLSGEMEERRFARK